MRLKEWMDGEGLNQEQLAAMIGCGQSTISRIIAGNGCDDEWKRRIYETSEGKVTPNDLLGLPFSA